MLNDDAEMENAQKHDHDLGNNIQESEAEVHGAKTETKGDNFPSAATAAGNAKKSENGGEDLNTLSNVAEDQIAVKSEIEGQRNNGSEISEPLNGDGLTGRQINTESKSEERSSTKNTTEEQTAAGIIEGKLTDANYEVIEQNAPNIITKNENSDENGVEGGNHVEKVEENPTGDVVVEEPRGTERGDGDCGENVTRKEKANENADSGSNTRESTKVQTELSANESYQIQSVKLDEILQVRDEEMEDAANANQDKEVNDEPKQQGGETLFTRPVTDGNAKAVETATEREVDDGFRNQHESTTANSLVRYSPPKVGDHSKETAKTSFTPASLNLMEESDDGTPEDQVAFLMQLESFYRERAMDFKPPKFYGQPLNCLKLWRAVIKLGGYDRVTGSKLWRQVGESFHPPKTCTTVSWTFRIFYEKSLLEFERHKIRVGDIQLPIATLPEASGADCEGNGHQGSGSGRARRDAAARAMQGWHAQRLFGYGEVGEPVIKDKNINNMPKREKNIKSIGSLKHKRPDEVDHMVKAARTETSKQLVTSVVDLGPPADWVKINVRQMKDCFEVYALVPGLLREEVRVQSDPAGRLVITGQPEQVDNPWGITPFKKVVSLPARIDPLQTSAVVSLHGRLFVRVPFELSNV